MTVKKIQPSSVLGNKFYVYELSSSNYTPALNASITITCKCTNVYGENVASKSLTLYQNGTSQGAKTTNSNGVATWTITCSNGGLQKFSIGDTSIDVFVDTKSENTHTHGNLSNDGKVSNTSSDVMQYFCGVGASANVLYKSDKLSSAKIIDTTAHTNIGSSANANQSTINSSIDTAIGNKAASTHTHGNLNNDGKITTTDSGQFAYFVGVGSSGSNLYKANHLNANCIEDTTAHSNIGSSANDTQSTINSKIDAALANVSNSNANIDMVTSSTGFSSTLTDTKVPSEKLIKEYVDGLIEDIQDYIYE